MQKTKLNAMVSLINIVVKNSSQKCTLCIQPRYATCSAKLDLESGESFPTFYVVSSKHPSFAFKGQFHIGSSSHRVTNVLQKEKKKTEWRNLLHSDFILLLETKCVALGLRDPPQRHLGPMSATENPKMF